MIARSFLFGSILAILFSAPASAGDTPIILPAPNPDGIAQPAPETAAAFKQAPVYSIAGQWRFNGTGTVNGYRTSDAGTITVGVTGTTGNEIITSVSQSGTITFEGYSPQTYSQTFGTYAPYAENPVYVVYDGLTYAFQQTSSREITLYVTGKQTSSNATYNMTYQATKVAAPTPTTATATPTRPIGTPTNAATATPTQGSGGSSGGGGCSLGFAPLALLLLLPLALLHRK